MIVAWVDTYYPEVKGTYDPRTLMFGATPELNAAIDTFFEAMTYHFEGKYVYQIEYAEACRVLGLERTEIPIVFYNADTLEEVQNSFNT